MTGLFLFFRVFQIQMAKCVDLIKIATKYDNQTMWVAFRQGYMALHRHINLLDFSIKEYNICLDMGFKSSGILTIIFMLKQEHTNMFSYLFILCYLVIYLYGTYVAIKLAYFPFKNSVVYKYTADFAARTQLKLSSVKSKQRALANKSRVMFFLRLDLMIDFLSHNRMGFGMGRRFFITKSRVVEEIMLNFYLLVLVYKKLRIY